MLCSGCDVFCVYCEAWSNRCSCIGSVSVSSCRCCKFVCILWQFIVSKALLISSATVIVHAGGAICLNTLLWCYLVSSSLSSVKIV